jgi:hypothetical protein
VGLSCVLPNLAIHPKLLYIVMIVKRNKLKLDTDEILNIALDMVDWNSIAADTAVHVHGKNIKKVMLMIDVS